MAGRRAPSSSPPPPQDQLNAGVILVLIAASIALTNQLAMAALTSTGPTNQPQQQSLLAGPRSALQTADSSFWPAREPPGDDEFKVFGQQKQRRANKAQVEATAEEEEGSLNLNLFTTKLSSGSPPYSVSTTSSASAASAGAAAPWPTTVTTTVSSRSTSGGGSGGRRATAPTLTATNGIVDRKTVVEHRNILAGELSGDIIITPLPLIDGPARHQQPEGDPSLFTSTLTFSQKNLNRNSPNQSSSPANSAPSAHSPSAPPLNDLQVDERRFLNEIVKNFNKSIVGNAIDFLPPGARPAATVNESHSTPHGQIAKSGQNGGPGDNSSHSTTSPLLNILRPQSKSSNSSPGAGPKSSGSGKTYEHKSDSAMLNYLFDSFVKHRPSDRRFGPHFVQADGIQLLNATAIVGGEGLLSCKISQLQDKTVSWVRRPVDTSEMRLLTVGVHTYSSDARFRVDFQYPDDWRLRIENVTAEDEGTYECMISTHPPQAIQTNFYVSSPEVLIVDEQGVPLYEKFYNLDSLLELKCIVSNIAMTASVVQWHHDTVSLNYDATRGGISVGTNLTEDAANSTLWVARVKPADSGNYTCSVGPQFHFTTSVHVLNESLAELHHGRGQRNSALDGLWLLAVCIVVHLIYAGPPTIAAGIRGIRTQQQQQRWRQDLHIR